MLEIKNRPLLHSLVARAIANVHVTSQSREKRNRWINALASATFTLENHCQFLQWDNQTKILTVWSESSEFYFVSSGKCQCKSFQNKQPCDHRAIYKIVSLYFAELKSERLNLSQTLNTPYLKNTDSRKLQSLGGVRF